jgi:hypothetical protein
MSGYNVTGVLVPAAIGDYLEDGTQNDKPKYSHKAGVCSIRWSSTYEKWYISISGSSIRVGEDYWLADGTDGLIEDIYSPCGTCTGHATVTKLEDGHGIIRGRKNEDGSLDLGWANVRFG